MNEKIQYYLSLGKLKAVSNECRHYIYTYERLENEQSSKKID